MGCSSLPVPIPQYIIFLIYMFVDQGIAKRLKQLARIYATLNAWQSKEALLPAEIFMGSNGVGSSLY